MKLRPHGGAAGPGQTGIQVLDPAPEHGSLYGGRGRRALPWSRSRINVLSNIETSKSLDHVPQVTAKAAALW